MTDKPRKTGRKEKKSEMLDVRLPYGMKRDLQDAARQNGETVSDAVRSLISGYIEKTRAATQTSTQDLIAMTFRKHPVKSAGAFGSAFAALAVFFAMPSTAQDVQPIAPPSVTYPADMIEIGASADCMATFDVSTEGRPENIDISCSRDGFDDSMMAAIWELRFEPKLVDGKPVRIKGVQYPIKYQLTESTVDIKGPA